MGDEPVDVWFEFVPRVEDPAVVRRQLELLSDDERARYERRPRGAARCEFRTARALVRRALSRRTDRPPDAWRFAEDAHGRPVIHTPPDTALDFNVSHTSGLVACAIGRDARVGVDVECLDRRRAVDRIAKRTFDAEELRDLESRRGDARVRRFLEYWTLKEALSKAEGRGIAGGALSVRFELDGEVTRCWRLDASGASTTERLHFRRAWPSERHALALAVIADDAPHVEVREWLEG